MALLLSDRVSALSPDPPAQLHPKQRFGTAGLGVSLPRPQLLHYEKSLFQWTLPKFAASYRLYTVPLFNSPPPPAFFLHCCQPPLLVLTPRGAPDSHFSDSDARLTGGGFNYCLGFYAYFWRAEQRK